MITLSFEKLVEIGTNLSSKLVKNGVEKTSELVLNIDSESFKKVDEDIFYNFKKQGMYEKDKEFIPSKDEIKFSFPKLNILIKSIS